VEYLIYMLIAFAAIFVFVGKRFYKIWMCGFIGVGIMLLVDLLGTGYNFYAYPRGILYLGGIPVLHIFQTYASSILYLNWLPRRRELRVAYTILASALFLAVEAIMYHTGAVIYPNWNLAYSFIILIFGLSVLGYLSDFVIKDEVEEETL